MERKIVSFNRNLLRPDLPQQQSHHSEHLPTMPAPVTTLGGTPRTSRQSLTSSLMLTGKKYSLGHRGLFLGNGSARMVQWWPFSFGVQRIHAKLSQGRWETLAFPLCSEQGTTGAPEVLVYRSLLLSFSSHGFFHVINAAAP